MEHDGHRTNAALAQAEAEKREATGPPDDGADRRGTPAGEGGGSALSESRRQHVGGAIRAGWRHAPGEKDARSRSQDLGAEIADSKNGRKENAAQKDPSRDDARQAQIGELIPSSKWRE
jgi:hypothetical protein